MREEKFPPLKKLLMTLINADLFHGSRWSLSAVIKPMGFTFLLTVQQKGLVENRPCFVYIPVLENNP